MKKQRLRKLTVLLTVAVCILSIGCLVSATTNNDTVSFSGNSRGYANVAHQVDVSSPSGCKTKLVGFTFNGMASGTMPNSNTEINFRLYETNHTKKVTSATAHTYSNYVNGTKKTATFLSGILPTTTDYYVIASNATNASGLGATVGVQWYYY